MSQKGVYTVERRRRAVWAVYSPSGSKVDSYPSYQDAQEAAARLNEKLKEYMNSI